MCTWWISLASATWALEYPLPYNLLQSLRKAGIKCLNKPNGEPTIWVQFSEATTMSREEVVCIGLESKTVKPLFFLLLLFPPHPQLPYGFFSIFQHIRERIIHQKKLRAVNKGRKLPRLLNEMQNLWSRTIAGGWGGAVPGNALCKLEVFSIAGAKLFEETEKRQLEVNKRAVCWNCPPSPVHVFFY